MDLKTMLYEKADGVAIATFNRPKVMNAIDTTVVEDLMMVINEVNSDSEVKALIITGGPKVFAAGGDIDYMLRITAVDVEPFIAETHKCFDALCRIDKPVIAAVGGLAFGGGLEIAMCCDIRIASEGTMMGLPECNLGLMAAAGGTQRLPKIVGIGWAKHMIMTGEPVDAQKALSLGLVTKVVPSESLMDEAKKIAKVLATKAPITAKLTKQSLNNSMYTDLQSALYFDQKVFAFIFATEDHTEGLKAFMEKRKPSFQGK